MADVRFRTTSAALRTTTGLQTIDLANFGTPKAAIVTVTSVVDGGTKSNDGLLCIGFTDGTTQNCFYAGATHGLASTDTFRGSRDSKLISFVTDGGQTGPNVEVSFSAWSANGIVLSVDTTNSLAYEVKVDLIGGIDVTNAYAGNIALAATSTDVNTVGFEPDLVFAGGTALGGTDFTAPIVHSTIHFGIAHNTVGVPQSGVSTGSPTGYASAATSNYVESGKIGGLVFAESVYWMASISNFDASGFTVDATADPGGDVLFYLALKFQNDPNIKVFDTKPTFSNSATQVWSDPGFKPTFGMMLQSDSYFNAFVQTDVSTALGITSFDADNTRSQGFTEQDAVGTSRTASWSAEGIHHVDEGGTTEFDGTFTAFTDTGWQFTYTTDVLIDKKWVGFAIDGGPTAVTGSLSSVEASGDSAAFTGAIPSSGSMAPQESSSDTLTATGLISTTGSLTVTESAPDGFTASGVVVNLGVFSATETGVDGFISSGKLPVLGSLSVTETAVDGFTASGSLPTTGTLSVTEVTSDGFTSSGNVPAAGVLSAQESSTDVMTSSGVIPPMVVGTMSATESGNDTFVAIHPSLITTAGDIAMSYPLTPLATNFSSRF